MREFVNQFSKIAEGVKFLPAEILVKKDEALRLMKPAAFGLGIKLRKVKKLNCA